ncbi:MAG TPA: cell wall hydrolase [Novosphingobium sp.]|nr:cell wall hydrolase [Novosphingobium sp.]
MRSKLNWASGIAVAATFVAAIFGGENSVAFAEEIVPAIIEPAPAPVETRFVSEPVIQVLSSGSPSPSQSEPSQDDDAGSLAELVAAQPHSGELTSDMYCLAGAIYFEARGESLEGQLAVGRVIVRRASSGRFPDSYCGVVFQRAQFSFVRGKTMPGIRKESSDWRKAVALARIAHNDSWDSKAEGALFFHAARVSPRWGKTRMARVDNHIFYR